MMRNATVDRTRFGAKTPAAKRAPASCARLQHALRKLVPAATAAARIASRTKRAAMKQNARFSLNVPVTMERVRYRLPNKMIHPASSDRNSVVTAVAAKACAETAENTEPEDTSGAGVAINRTRPY